MALPSGVTIELTTPGGVLTRRFSDGAATMRICVGHLDAERDGLLVEMRAGHEPVPWAGRESRAEALESIRTRKGLTDDDRERLLRHVARTAYYEGAG